MEHLVSMLQNLFCVTDKEAKKECVSVKLYQLGLIFADIQEDCPSGECLKGAPLRQASALNANVF